MSERKTVPLVAIANGFVGKAEVFPNSTSGDKWGYSLYLSTTAKRILTVSSEPPTEPKTTTTDFAMLTFHEESQAKHILAVILHAADLCRMSAGSQSAPEPIISGPSLKETLDWLKEKLLLATVSYVMSEHGDRFSVSPQSPVFSLDSCTSVIGSRVALRNLSHPAAQHDMMGRYTVPLGALTTFSIERIDPLEHDDTFISGERWVYSITMASKSRDISVIATFPTASASDSVKIVFGDESLASRVMEAFKHAAELCRRKEPF